MQHQENCDYWVEVHAEWAELYEHCEKNNTGLLKEVKALMDNARENVKRLTQPYLFT